MSDRLPPDRLERLCVAVGFKAGYFVVDADGGEWGVHTEKKRAESRIDYLKETREIHGQSDEPDKFHVEERWPALDLDDTWAVKSMEALVRVAGHHSICILPPGTGCGGGRVSELWRVDIDGYYDTEGEGETLPLSLCRALDAALDAGELDP